jgi:hypothetical protein
MTEQERDAIIWRKGKRTMGFAEFIMKRRPITDDPRGDFIDDTRWLIEKKQLPDCPSWDELREFMELRGACEAAVEAGRKVWLEYG